MKPGWSSRAPYTLSADETIDMLVSCDGKWQKCGFTSLFGAAFVIDHEIGKVVDYIVNRSINCVGCKYWEKDQSSEAYKKRNEDWQVRHPTSHFKAGECVSSTFTY